MGYTPPHLEVRKVAGGWNVYPSGVTTDDLFIYANPADTTPAIQMYGNGAIELRYAAGGGYVYIREGTNIQFKFYYSGDDKIIETLEDAKNLFLKTTGTGKVKFGTYTAGAAGDSTGYISIIDAGGTARKLMVQA